MKPDLFARQTVFPFVAPSQKLNEIAIAAIDCRLKNPIYRSNAKVRLALEAHRKAVLAGNADLDTFERCLRRIDRVMKKLHGGPVRLR